MAFRNSILAGEELVRSGIRSEDYVAGVSGWRIARDGTAEFLDVAVRGTFTTGTGDPRIEIVPDDAGFGPTILFYPDGGGPPAALRLLTGTSIFGLFSPDTDTTITVANDAVVVSAGVNPNGTVTLQAGDSIILEQIPLLGPDLIPALSLPHTEAANVAPVGTIVATGAPVNLPGVRLRVQNFTKLSDDTKLVVAFTGASRNSGGLNVFSVYADVAGADTLIADVLGVAETQAGARAITGIAAGTFDVEIQANVSAGTQTMTGRWSLTVTETY